jgi:hypothetical protein
MENICGGTHCNLAFCCKKHTIGFEEGTYAYYDASVEGSGGANCEDTWHCGDLSKNYPLFEIDESVIDRQSNSKDEPYYNRMPNLQAMLTAFQIMSQNIYKFEHKIYADDLDVYTFPQMWGSTALGFGGIGGQAMTKALTTVIYDPHNDFCAVFFDGRLAYYYKNPSGAFFEDIRLMRMEPCSRSAKYR